VEPIRNSETAPFRHGQLARGALQEPHTLHLHVDFGGQLGVARDLCQRLSRAGATPKETWIVEQATEPNFPFDRWEGHQSIPAPAGKMAGLVSMPTRLADEMETYLNLLLRRLDDTCVHPF
jgi:hypothetical protein